MALGKVEGFWKHTATAAANADQIFEGWGSASSLATDTAGTNQLFPIENDVIASKLS